MNQKGFAPILIVLLVTLVTVGGIYFYQTNQKTKGDFFRQNPDVVSKANPASQIYSSQNLGFTFKYPAGLNVKEDTEEGFNKRGNGDYRKNFKGYVQYDPGKFLGGVVVLDKSNSYDTNPFTLWVFDNPNDLTIDEWYKNYWYYPFVWGDFTYTGKVELAPKDEATVSGQMAKSGIIDYQPGKPKFIYIAKDKIMYLFRIIGDVGEQILSSFKFPTGKKIDTTPYIHDCRVGPC